MIREAISTWISLLDGNVLLLLKKGDLILVALGKSDFSVCHQICTRVSVFLHSYRAMFIIPVLVIVREVPFHLKFRTSHLHPQESLHLKVNDPHFILCKQNIHHSAQW